MLVESPLSKKQIVWGHLKNHKNDAFFLMELRNEEGFPNGTAACKKNKTPLTLNFEHSVIAQKKVQDILPVQHLL